jgi:hypothetical protein
MNFEPVQQQMSIKYQTKSWSVVLPINAVMAHQLINIYRLIIYHCAFP